MAFANVSASLYLSIPDACATRLAGTSAITRLSLPNSARFGTAFATGSPVYGKALIKESMCAKQRQFP